MCTVRMYIHMSEYRRRRRRRRELFIVYLRNTTNMCARMSVVVAKGLNSQLAHIRMYVGICGTVFIEEEITG